MSWQRWRGWAFVGGLLAAVAVAGCDSKSSGDDDDDDDDDDDNDTSSSSASCSSICNDIEDAACPDADPVSECVSGCTQTQNIVQSAGCTADWNSYLDCIDGVSDRCALAGSTNPCPTELNEVVACITPYCMDNPEACSTTSTGE